MSDAALLPRDARQFVVLDWAKAAFGDGVANSPPERASRVLEEAIELAQAAGIDLAGALKLVMHVYSKPAGEPAQEAGGLGVTLLAYCESIKLSADRAEADEINRILARPIEHFRARHAAKAAAGIATPPEVQP